MKIVVEATELVASLKSGVTTARHGLLLGLLDELSAGDELIVTHQPTGRLPPLPPARSASVTVTVGRSWYRLVRPLISVARALGWPLALLKKARAIVQNTHRQLADRPGAPVYARRLAKEKRPDIFLSSELVYFAFPGAKTVAVIHDMLPVKSPQWFTACNTENFRRKLDHVVGDCDAVLVDSEATLRDARKFLPLPADRYFVVPLAADPAFRPAEPSERFDDLDERFGLKDRRVVLYVGTIEPRKNLGRLTDAIERLLREPNLRDVCLLVAGGVGWHCEELLARWKVLQAAGHVVRAGYVDYPTLVRLYRRAELFAFVSEDEGFGLPAVEAMQSGTPLVCSGAGSLAEVAGQSAVLVEATSPVSIADGLRRLLEDPRERARFRALGLDRARLYSWSATARRAIDVFRWLAGEGDRPSSTYQPSLPAASRAA